MISANLTPIPQNSIKKTTVWHKSFFTSLTIFLIKCDLYQFFTYGTQTQSSQFAYFHHLPMISGNLTPIPQNIITKTAVCHKTFFHISHNFVNKMRLLPIFHIQQNCTSFFFTYPLVQMVIIVKLTLIPQNNFTEAILWHKKFFHIIGSVVTWPRQAFVYFDLGTKHCIFIDLLNL